VNFPVPVLTTGDSSTCDRCWFIIWGFIFVETGGTNMYMYDETTGKKGSNGSVPLLKHYIDKYI
jgi:hypothetical protein